MIRPTVRDAADSPVWHIRDPRGGLNAGLESWRFNAALRYARDTSRYPYSLEVVVPFAQVRDDGRPTAAEIERLADIEDAVLAGVGDRAVLAGVLTRVGVALSEGDQRFVFYTGSPDWTARLRSQLRGATGVGNLRVNCDPDPHWYEYRSLWGREILRPRPPEFAALFARARFRLRRLGMRLRAIRNPG